MSTFKDLTGQTFGRLTVIALAHKHKRYYWLCQCICGNEKIVAGNNLGRRVRSCGCLQQEARYINTFTHGESNDIEHKLWDGIKQRCYNKDNPNYRNYGERGIVMSDDWRDNYMNFKKDMGNKPYPEATIERKDNNKNYSKDNCMWATRKQQCNNTRVNRFISINGKILTIAQLSEKYNINYPKLYYRLIISGWPIEKALELDK